ncbi:hypothetical protein D9M68_858390 [compost metagenome]
MLELVAQAHAVARHDAFALEPCDARDHGGARDLELSRQVGGGLPGIGLEQAQQVAVEVVKSSIHRAAS